MSELNWFSAKQIFLHKPDNEKIKPWYEERIIIVKAENEQNAIDKALKNGSDYCLNDDETCYFIGIVDNFELYDSEIDDEIEVYSKKIMSSLNSNEFISHFYPDSLNDCEAVGENHYWHNKDGKNSACYNCQIEREGRLWESKNE